MKSEMMIFSTSVCIDQIKFFSTPYYVHKYLCFISMGNLSFLQNYYIEDLQGE